MSQKCQVIISDLARDSWLRTASHFRKVCYFFQGHTASEQYSNSSLGESWGPASFLGINNHRNKSPSISPFIKAYRPKSEKRWKGPRREPLEHTNKPDPSTCTSDLTSQGLGPTATSLKVPRPTTRRTDDPVVTRYPQADLYSLEVPALGSGPQLPLSQPKTP